jgi:hypothetical protein
MYFSKRLLKYESTANPTNLDYGEVSQVLTDKLINVNMGGSSYILESVGVAGSYIPKVGDWVVVEWQNGTPIAKGDSTTTAGSGLININTPTIVSPSDMASGTVNSDHIRVNSIEAQHLQAGSVTAYAISANSITASAISANAIQTQHISANSIQGSQIQAGTITTNNIQAGAITGTLISANSISSVQLQANSVTAVQISANAVQTQHISANSIIASQIQAGAITTNAISANSIIASLIQSNAIQTQHISSNSILGYQIQANQISGSHIIANMISANHITANAIGAIHITANAITSIAISSNSIQARHISANSILANMISANQINATHISANSILSNMISANQIQTQHISANSIQSQQISANSIQTQHISANTIVGNQIQASQISGNHIVAGTLDATKLTVGTLQQGLLGQYYTYSAGASNKFQTFKGSQIDTTINFNWGTSSPSLVGQNDYYAMRWQGFVSAPETGSFQFVVTADEGTTLTINNNKIINNWNATNGAPVTGNISLTQGSFYPIVLEYFESTGNSNVMLEWIRPSLIRQVVPSQYLTQGNTVIDGSTITTGTITASSMQVGTITAQSGILANAVIQTANIADGVITSAKIGVGEIKTANIASGNITNALIQDATITSAKIVSVDAGTINVGQLNGGLIKANTISGGAIIGSTITGDKIQAGAIDTLQLKAGAVVTNTISAGAITSDRIMAGAITGDLIRAGSITAQHISTVGLDAQLVQVYNGLTGETLVGGGYLRVDGLDVGVIQSDNLILNGLFLVSSDQYGIKRQNEQGQTILGLQSSQVGGSQVWAYNNTTYAYQNSISIAGKKPVSMVFDPSANVGYVSVVGDNSVYKVDLTQYMTLSTVKVGTSPSQMYVYGNNLFVLNGDINDTNEPDNISVINLSTFTVVNTIYVGESPFAYAVSGNLMYVSCSIAGIVYIVNMDTQKIIGAINIVQGSSYPTGISLSSDGTLLYVADGLLNVLWVVSLANNQIINQIPIGNGSAFVRVSSKTRKIFISCAGSDSIYILDESNILPMGNGNVRSVHTGYKPIGLTLEPNKGANGYLYIALSQAGVIAIMDMTTETLVGQINAGANVLSTAISPNDSMLYAINNGDIGIISFIYPSGNFIGDAYVGSDSQPKYQGAYGWTPDRSNWLLDTSGNVLGASTVEFHIGEPFYNEGGYAKLQTIGGAPTSYAQIEQDVYLVKNYSNGNNTKATTNERLMPYTYVSGTAIFYPTEVSWLNSPIPSNFIVSHSDGSGNILSYTANASTDYSLSYGANSSVLFSGGIVPSGGWVTANYSFIDSVWFNKFNGSVEINIDQSTTTNSVTTFEIDEYVPKFVIVEDQQTSSFTPTSDGINQQYNGLILSTTTDQALNTASGNIIMSGGSTSYHYGGTNDKYDISRVVNGSLDTTNYFEAGSGNASVKIDLGITYMIGEIDVWHYYADSRKYHNTKTEVSADGVSWTSVFDSKVSGEYVETASGNTITFNPIPVRYVRDWVSGNTVDNINRWVAIKAKGDWIKDTSYKYPNQTPMTLNGSVIKTSVQGAYAQYTINTEYTTQWYYTFLKGQEFGVAQVFVDGTQMNYPVADGVNRFYLFQNSNANQPSFFKSAVPLKSGTHTITIYQSSGEINIDRLRFEDFQYYNRNSLQISNNSGSDFTRYKIVPTLTSNYVGQGRQTTDGAFDIPRVNPKTGMPDGSVALKYRFRVKNTLSNSNGSQGQGISYVTSAVFEKGKQSTNWRMSQSLDKLPSIRMEEWTPSKPTTTGVQTKHIANGAIQGEKIHAYSIDNHHISPFANIPEFKLALNYATHGHTNKSLLDSIAGYAGTSGNYGTGNTIARGDHIHPLASSTNAGFMDSNSYSKLQELIAVNSGNTNVSSTPTSGSSLAISSGWAYTHSNTLGIGAHVPTGGTSSTFLRGDGTWQPIVATVDTYVTGISGNGNGTLYLNQNNGQSQLTLDLSHTHSQYVLNNSNNQTVNTGFTVNGASYVGANNGSGALYVRTGTGTLGIQLAGDNLAQQSGVNSYINASGNANFSGTMTANAIAVTSTGLVNNLNAQMVNSIKEPQLAKNWSIAELGGKGVYTGTQVQAQSVPNMTVQLTSGTAYTNSGMRIIVSAGGSIAFATPSATYNRIDSVYIQGSSAGANEGVVTVLQGTAQASPVAPTIPSDGVLLANVTIRQNAGSILATDIADARIWKSLSVSGQNTYVNYTMYVNTIASTGGYINLGQPIKNTPSNNSVTIPVGQTSYTWTHNLNLPQYVVKLSCNSSEPHIYWSNKTANAITVNLDDACVNVVTIDIGIEAF